MMNRIARHGGRRWCAEPAPVDSSPHIAAAFVYAQRLHRSRNPTRALRTAATGKSILATMDSRECPVFCVGIDPRKMSCRHPQKEGSISKCLILNGTASR
jgi:hypothetical protein